MYRSIGDYIQWQQICGLPALFDDTKRTKKRQILYFATTAHIPGDDRICTKRQISYQKTTVIGFVLKATDFILKYAFKAPKHKIFNKILDLIGQYTVKRRQIPY